MIKMCANMCQYDYYLEKWKDDITEECWFYNICFPVLWKCYLCFSFLQSGKLLFSNSDDAKGSLRYSENEVNREM